MTRLFRRLARWLTRLLLRAGILPASAKADTDTMGEYKRLLSEKDDPKPGLVLPDPNAPHAALIRRVRLYAQNGAKALAPLLDRPISMCTQEDDMGLREDWDAMFVRWQEVYGAARGDNEARAILEALMPYAEGGAATSGMDWDKDAMRAIHAAYNAPTTIIDGEVYEFESEKRRRVVQ